MLISLQRIIKSGVISFRRNSVLSLAAIGVMTLTLSGVTSLMLLRVTTNHVVAALRDKVDISVYFTLEASEDEILKLRQELQGLSEVKDIEYVSQDEAIVRFKERYQNNRVVLEALNEVEKNPLPSSFNIRAHQASQYAAISQFLENDRFKPLVNKVNYYENQQMIQRLFSLTNIISRSGLILSIILAAIAILVAFNTIRLAIYNLKEEIAVMRLVGAGNWFIRGPFIVMGSLAGIIAAGITMAMFYVIVYYISPKIEMFVPGLSLWTYYNANLLQIFLAQIGIGIGLGVVSSIVAMNNYLRT